MLTAVFSIGSPSFSTFLWVFIFPKKLKFILKQWVLCFEYIELQTTLCLAALWDFFPFFLRQTFLSPFLCSYAPLSCRYHALPFFLPSVTSPSSPYSWDTAPRTAKVVSVWRGRFQSSFQGSEEGCAFLFFHFCGLSHLYFYWLATVFCVWSPEQSGMRCKSTSL